MGIQLGVRGFSNNYEFSEYLLETNVFMQWPLVRILFVFFLTWLDFWQDLAVISYLRKNPKICTFLISPYLRLGHASIHPIDHLTPLEKLFSKNPLSEEKKDIFLVMDQISKIRFLGRVSLDTSERHFKSSGAILCLKGYFFIRTHNGAVSKFEKALFCVLIKKYTK